jgi:hypothetical protein
LLEAEIKERGGEESYAANSASEDTSTEEEVQPPLKLVAAIIHVY